MTVPVTLVLVLACLLLNGAFSGSETGFYSASPVRLDLEAQGGSRPARLARWLLRNDSALLVTILVGNNLTLELCTHLVEHLFLDLGLSTRQATLGLTLVLTPVVFLFGEVLPKELFRRRPHALLVGVVGIVAVARFLFWPLERVLSPLAHLIQRLVGAETERDSLLVGRLAVMEFLEEGRRHGALSERAAALAGNALTLRSIPISKVMVPWDQVVRLSLDDPPEVRRRVLEEVDHSRLPVCSGGECTGYAHVLDVLGAGPDADPGDHLRPLVRLPGGTPVARALLQMRGKGLRMALVGEGPVPLGLVTLKDLVEELSGDLADL